MTSNTENLIIPIRSKTKNYVVKFNNVKPLINNRDVLVIDKKVSELYDITSDYDRIIRFDANEENKYMENVLNVD
jgi:negative regulator of genetic competence, sporulation and motility